MRVLIVAALLAAGSVSAQSEFLKGEDLQKEIARNCQHGCIVLSPEEAENLQMAINAMLHANAQRAYEAAKQEAAQSCKLRT
jgi:hypothetical protein